VTITPHSLRPRMVRTAQASVAAAASVLLLAACGGVATQTEPTGTAECGTEITIGAPLPLSGPFSEIGTTALQGAQLAVDHINEAGGIAALGNAQLVLAPGDTSSTDTTQASSAAAKLISDGAVALVGAWATTLTVPIAPVAEREQVPIVTQSWGDVLSQNGYTFYFQPPAKASQMGGAGAQYILDAAEAAGVEFGKVTAVAPNDAANVEQYTKAVAVFADNGSEAADPVFYQTGITDVTPIVTAIVAADPDLILTGGSPADSVLIVKGLRDAGITAPMLSFGGAFSGTAPSFAEALGDAVNGLTVVTAWNGDLPFDGVADASAQYQEEYGTTYMPDLAGESWVNVYLIAQAMEEAESCDPVDIAAALRDIQGEGPGAAMPGGSVTFAEDGTNPNAVPILLQWQDGVPVTIWPENVAQSELDPGE
jgi:branched-chain amino acid transport system substrate-binding protein